MPNCSLLLATLSTVQLSACADHQRLAPKASLTDADRFDIAHLDPLTDDTLYGNPKLRLAHDRPYHDTALTGFVDAACMPRMDALATSRYQRFSGKGENHVEA
jgi:hypothetical protein